MNPLESAPIPQPNNMSNPQLSVLLNPSNYPKFTICPKCNQIPLISVYSHKDVTKIRFECLCSNKSSSTIFDYVAELERIINSNHFCEVIQQHNTLRADAFCAQCNKWLCKECLIYHNGLHSSHQIQNIPIRTNLICQKHKDQNIDIYCKNCKESLCRICFNENHKGHKMEKFEDLNKKVDLNKIKENIKKIEEHMEIDKKLKEDTINNLLLEIDKINHSYEIYEKSNSMILKMIKIILNNYNSLLQINQTNINSIMNILNNTKFNSQTCLLHKEKDGKEPSLLVNLNYINRYFNNYCIIHPVKKSSIILEDTFTLKKSISLDDYINSVIVLLDGRIATGSKDRSITIYNQITMEQELVIKNAHESNIYSLCQLSNNKIFSASADGMLNVWSIVGKEFEKAGIMKGHKDGVFKVIALTKNRVASCSFDNSIGIWSGIKPYNNIKMITMPSFVSSIIQLKDIELLVSASTDINFFTLTDYKKKPKAVKKVFCNSMNALAELKHRRLIVGGSRGLIFIINNELYTKEIVINGIEMIDRNDIGWRGVFSFIMLDDGSVLCGTPSGTILHLEGVFYQCVYKQTNGHQKSVVNLTKVWKNKIISTSLDCNLNVWEY